ncbi:HEL329Cp [Eremothecium sinecaudum]|uniref:HEL329Cp n=1 Tax=Eremothecium sinecaudum TaxID=45286 RepID=A0A0X8HT29_9SACH|nr:HEL329Cp [Eremothecium sinecaudum]AMD20952.1 HEL329Cp [Eremothecium sinecaudum]
MAPSTKKSGRRTADHEHPKRVTKKPKIAVNSSDEEYPESDDQHQIDAQSSGDDADDLDSIISSDDESDELDQSSGDENGDDEDAEDHDELDGDKEEKSSNEPGRHSEQRKLLKERKMKRKSGTQVQQIKSLWERLRVKQPPMPREIREKLSNEVWELAKDHISDLVLKHDASRVVQTLVKYSPKERRDQIVDSLKGKFYLLATSSYGKYLLVKLLHYGSKNSRDTIIAELHGKLRKLMRHREGAYVVEDLFVLYSTQEQRQQMIREFWGAEYAVFRETHKNLTIEKECESSVEKRNIIAKNLSGTIAASVDKGSAGFQILHAAMKEYVKIANEKEISEFIETLKDQYAELVHTPEGSEVICVLIAKANAKERKSIIKNLKDHSENLLKNQYGNQVFITLLMTVDDTVLLYKAFSASLKDKITSMITDKWARRPFLYILLGLDGKYFSPIVKKDLDRYLEMSKSTSKKPLHQKRDELLQKFGPFFLSAIAEDYSKVLEDNMGCQFVSELLTNDELYLLLSDDEKSKFQELIDCIIVYFKGSVSDEEHPINRPFSGRLLKSLIQGGKWNNKEKRIEPLNNVKGLGAPFAEKIYNDIIDSTNLLEWINNSNSSFTIVAIYECLSSKKEGAEFMRDLKAIASKIDKDDDMNKGAQLLLKFLSI